MLWRRFLGNSEWVQGERGERIWKYRPKSIYPFAETRACLYGTNTPSLIVLDMGFGSTQSSTPPRSEVWVFRNLTSLEYVRSNAMPTSDNWDRQLRYELQTGLQGAPGLAQVLFMQIAWSTSEGHRLPRFSKIAPGYLGV